jgi:hypothetical protein
MPITVDRIAKDNTDPSTEIHARTFSYNKRFDVLLESFMKHTSISGRTPSTHPFREW